MRVLKVTNMYPTAEQPQFGIFVQQETESLRRLGVDVDVLFVNGRSSKLNYLTGAPRLWSRLRDEEYDLVHAHYIFAGLLALTRRRLPIVLTHHGAEVFEGWQGLTCRMFTRWFDAAIVRTEEMKTRLGVDEAHIIPGGINMEKFRPQPSADCRTQLGLPLDGKLVLWAGDPRPDKRFDLAVAAMRRLDDHLPGVELIKLTGREHSLVPRYMNACDVLLLTSDSEGSPNVVKEAMACDLPVVGRPVGDVREVIGATEGCHLTSEDPGDIARKLELALARGGRTNGHEAVAHLELGAIGRQIIDVYRQTLAAAGREDIRLPAAPRS